MRLLAALLAVPAALAPSLLGHSVDGRAIRALAVGDPAAPARVLVVGDIHGNEPAGIPIARAVLRLRPVTGVSIWVVPDLNPDGVARGARQNAHGVDLNRNFPSNWARIGRRGAYQWSGPHPLSEPESRYAVALVRRLRPQITIWFHQPQGLVRGTGPSAAVARRYARLAGMRFRALPRPPGAATEWQHRALPGTRAFVVELPPGPLGIRAAGPYARAVVELVP